MARGSDLGSISTKLDRIAKLAREDSERELLTLAHHIDDAWLHEAYRRTRKSGAPGVDGTTAAQYAEDLEGNLDSLRERFKSGRYKAPPVRRAQIPKGDGSETRPIGIPTFEDKVLQRAVAMVLEAVYEEDFLDCSYGFRPGRSAHDALEALWNGAMKMGGGWVVEADIQDCFGTLEHGHLREFLDQRVRDGVIRRTIDKWLKAGVMDESLPSHPDEGTPQGGVISPLLANVYLHHVLDRWFEDEVRPRLSGPSCLVRYADDFVIVCQREDDARRVLEVLPKRFARYGLTLHPDKTRLVRFTRPPHHDDSGKGPGSFGFLGFTHFWGRSQRGNWVVRRKTAASRSRRTLKRIAAWCRAHRHRPLEWQCAQLTGKLLGHYQYYGVTGNFKALERVRFQVEQLWRKWLSRRSHKAWITQERFNRLRRRFPLPRPRTFHSALASAQRNLF